MQISGGVVQSVAVNVVNNLAFLGTSNFAMLPFSTARTTATLPLRVKGGTMGATSFLNGWIGSWGGECKIRAGSHRYMSPSELNSYGFMTALLLVCEQRISMTIKHLVVAHTQFFRGNWPGTVFASPADNLSTPAVFGGSVFADSFVVHQAVTARSVFSCASCNRTSFHTQYSSTLDKALGNSCSLDRRTNQGSSRRYSVTESDLKKLEQLAKAATPAELSPQPRTEHLSPGVALAAGGGRCRKLRRKK